MFKKGDKVTLTYYDEPHGQVESGGWVVAEYDNGLMKAVKKPSPHLKKMLDKMGVEEKPKKEVVVFNLRSIGFLKAELVE